MNGPVAAGTPLKFSINPLSQPTRVFAIITILFLLQVPALVVSMIPGHILLEIGRRNLARSQCLSVVSSLLLASWMAKEAHTSPSVH
jgi:membrane protease YdiL (CAAX protease family)